MKTRKRRRLLISLSIVLALPAGSATLAGKEEKMKGADLLAKHLEAIGTVEARAAAKSRAAVGIVQAIFRHGGQGHVRGKGMFLSDGNKLRINWAFALVDYPGEQLAFDGSKVSVGDIRAGIRTELSDFVYHYDFLLKEGLLGGALTTAWAPLAAVERRPKLDYSGLKKTEGVQLHELKYRARKGSSDVQVWLYFEPESFRHVRSRYRLTIPGAPRTATTDSAGRREIYHTITEQFGEFKTVDGLTLPHTYSLEFAIEGGPTTFLATWSVDGIEIAHNPALEDASFKVK